MGETLAELRDEYDSFLRGERFNLTDRITTAIDDFRHTTTTQQQQQQQKGDAANAANNSCPRVTIRMAELRASGFSERLRLDPLRHLRALEVACHTIATEHIPGYDKNISNSTSVPLKVAITGPIGAAPSSPRQLTSSVLRQLVSVEGVATKVSTIKPKVQTSVHYCPTTKKHQSRNYVDATDPQLGLHATDATGQELPDRYIQMTNSVYPSKDEENNPLETEYGLCQFKDHQTISLQEMPEKAPMGQLPRSVELILDNDLVDKIKPGDRVLITGVYRALANTNTQSSSGQFKTVILVNNVQILGRDVHFLNFSTDDVRNIKQLASQSKDILHILGRSIAPSIHGHEMIKCALALQLLSGVEKNLDNGTHLRGDINILMVGDPSTAKSQLLRSAMTIAPLAVSTTGKGSSGVGLTAAVTSDPDTKERRLEAGAMVLADRGLVCVDEFDKMGENDRVAIHEAMEQQTVTIAKAGIHASLNARCSVLAAANPVYGQYDRRRKIQENIGLPDSLLSRFDLLFVVLDQMDPVTDRKIANHVIRGHRRLAVANSNNNTGADDVDSDDEDDDDELLHNSKGGRSIWQRNCHAENKQQNQQQQQVLQLDFLRKYLHFAKTRVQPVLTDEAREWIAVRYAEMRSRQDERTLPVTARSLETVIRMATAHAKARLSDIVEEIDCEMSMDILHFALYHEEHHHPTTTQDKESTEEEEEPHKRGLTSVVSEDEPSSPNKRLRTNTTDKDSSDLLLQQQIWECLQEQDSLEIDELTESIQQAMATVDKADILEAVQVLVRDGRLMETEGLIVKV